MDASECRRILGIPTTATAHEINRAYKKKILKMHPDKGGDEEKAKLINQARDYLLKNISKSNSNDDLWEDLSEDEDESFGCSSDDSEFEFPFAETRTSAEYKAEFEACKKKFNPQQFQNNFYSFYKNLLDVAITELSEDLKKSSSFHCGTCDKDFHSQYHHYEKIIKPYAEMILGNTLTNSIMKHKNVFQHLQDAFGDAWEWNDKEQEKSTTTTTTGRKKSDGKAGDTLLNMISHVCDFATEVENPKSEVYKTEFPKFNKSWMSKPTTTTGSKKVKDLSHLFNPPEIQVEFIKLEHDRKWTQSLSKDKKIYIDLSSVTSILDSEMELRREHLPFYVMGSLPRLSGKKVCYICQAGVLSAFKIKCCKACGKAICEKCGEKKPVLNIGYNTPTTICKNCEIKSLEIDAELWANKAHCLLTQGQQGARLVILFMQISHEYSKRTGTTGKSDSLKSIYENIYTSATQHGDYTEFCEVAIVSKYLLGTEDFEWAGVAYQMAKAKSFNCARECINRIRIPATQSAEALERWELLGDWMGKCDAKLAMECYERCTFTPIQWINKKAVLYNSSMKNEMCKSKKSLSHQMTYLCLAAGFRNLTPTEDALNIIARFFSEKMYVLGAYSVLVVAVAPEINSYPPLLLKKLKKVLNFNFCRTHWDELGLEIIKEYGECKSALQCFKFGDPTTTENTVVALGKLEAHKTAIAVCVERKNGSLLHENGFQLLTKGKVETSYLYYGAYVSLLAEEHSNGNKSHFTAIEEVISEVFIERRRLNTDLPYLVFKLQKSLLGTFFRESLWHPSTFQTHCSILAEIMQKEELKIEDLQAIRAASHFLPKFKGFNKAEYEKLLLRSFKGWLEKAYCSLNFVQLQELLSEIHPTCIEEMENFISRKLGNNSLNTMPSHQKQFLLIVKGALEKVKGNLLDSLKYFEDAMDTSPFLNEQIVRCVAHILIADFKLQQTIQNKMLQELKLLKEEVFIKCSDCFNKFPIFLPECNVSKYFESDRGHENFMIMNIFYKYLQGKSNLKAGFAYLDLGPSLKGQTAQATCLLEASSHFLTEMETSSDDKTVFALWNLIQKLCSEVIQMVGESATPYFEIYVGRMTFSLLLKSSYHLSKIVKVNKSNVKSHLKEELISVEGQNLIRSILFNLLHLGRGIPFISTPPCSLMELTHRVDRRSRFLKVFFALMCAEEHHSASSPVYIYLLLWYDGISKGWIDMDQSTKEQIKERLQEFLTSKIEEKTEEKRDKLYSEYLIRFNAKTLKKQHISQTKEREQNLEKDLNKLSNRVKSPFLLPLIISLIVDLEKVAEKRRREKWRLETTECLRLLEEMTIAETETRKREKLIRVPLFH